ncbi:MAG: MFS transporter [Treponema sp.]|nr:MFS transporter [Treponema sp.]
MLQSNKTSKLLLYVLFGTMFLFGFLENIKGVSYPLIKNEFGVSYETQAMMVSALAISYTLFVVASGFMLSYYKVKIIYLLGIFLCLFSISSIYFMPGFWMVALSLFLLSAGFGVVEISVNAVATQIFLKKPALMMNLLHFMYGAGAIAGPKAAGILADPAGIGMPWRQIYILATPLIMIIFISFMFSKVPVSETSETVNHKTQETAEQQKKHGFISALKTPAVWAFGIVLGVGVGLELAPSNWGGLYFQDLFGMDPTTSGANYVSAYYILFTLSRLVSGFLIEKIGYISSLLWAIIISTVIFAVGFVLGPAGIYVLPFLGFFLAIIWPTVMAIAIGRFGSNAPIMTSAIIAIAGLLNAGIQFVIGYIDHWAGAGWGYRSCLVFAAILICLLMVFRNSMSKKA